MIAEHMADPVPVERAGDDPAGVAGRRDRGGGRRRAV